MPRAWHLAALSALIAATVRPVVADAAPDEAMPVVTDQDVDSACSVAGERLHVSRDTLVPVPFAEVRAGAPRLASGAPLQSCAAPAVGPFEDLLSRAEGALLYGEFDTADARLAEARNAAVCGHEVSPSRLARLELVAGLVAEERGRGDEATARYTAAFGFDPALAWHEAYPAERRGRFDAARAASQRVSAPLVVIPAEGATIDGGPIAGAVVGEHVVQVGGVGVRVTLDALPNTLVVPGGFPGDALGRMSDPSARAELTALLASHLGEAREAVVVHGDEVWTGLTGRTDWELHRGAALDPSPVPVPPAPPAPPAPTRRCRSAAPWVTTVVGLAVGGVGGVVTGLEVGAAVRAVDDVTADPGRYADAKSRYDAAARGAVAGYGLIGVGSAVGGVGIAWNVGRAVGCR